MTKQKPLYLFHLLALCIVCVWGTTFVSTKTLISNGLTPTEIFIYRFALAYICVLFMAPRRLFADTFADEMRMIAAGLTGGSVYFITENTALGMMQATNVAILISVTPLLATLVGMAVFRSERTKRPERVILGSVVAMAGVVVILWNGGDFAAFNPCGTALTFSARCRGLSTVCLSKSCRNIMTMCSFRARCLATDCSPWLCGCRFSTQ